MSKSRLRDLLIKGHITYKEYIAEIDRLNEARNKLYDLYVKGRISREELTEMLEELDREEGDLPEPPTVY